MLRAGFGLNFGVSHAALSAGITPALDLNFASMAAAGALDSRITFSRGTLATCFDATGKLTYCGNNYLTYSSDFTNVAWTKNNATVSVAGSISSPVSGGTVAKLVEAAGVNRGSLRQYTVVVGNIISVYAKAAEWGNLCLGISNNGGLWGVVNFNLSAGTVGASTTYGGSTVGSPAMTPLPDGWYRCQVTVTACSGLETVIIMPFNQAGDPVNPVPALNGDGTSGIYVCAAQAEAVTYQTSARTYNATTSTAYYGPAFDYDPVTLGSLGVSVWEQRTNLLTYSEQFDNAAWTKTRSSVTANATTSPSGTATADKLVEDATAGATHPISQGVTVTAAAQTLSCYLKAGERTWAQLNITGTANAYANFNLSTGVAGTVGAAATATITNVGNGWYRCAITATTAAGANTAAIYPASADNTISYNGDGTSGVYVWGAQIEAGAFATSYIPTTSATATRNEDSLTMTGTNFSSWFNATAGTFVAQADGQASGTAFVISANNGASNDAISIRGSGTDPRFAVLVGGASQCDIDAGTISATTAFKISAAYASASFGTSVNGGAAVTTSSGSLPTVSQLNIGASAAGASPVNGHIRSLTYYSAARSAAELQALSA
jgi:hypothetical protein